jgi:protein phosphatase
MGATLSLAWFTPGLMWFAHLGDSRIYHLPVDGGLVQITHDHSQVGRLRRAGRIDERAARSHHSRHILDQVLGGTDHAIEPHLGAVVWRPGDTFVICSDGVMDGLWDRAIEEQVRAPVGSRAEQPPAQRLVEEAVLHSGRDNATAIVVELTATAQT